jgi:1,2-diacylglycerol 3-beta-glucosyltransferase
VSPLHILRVVIIGIAILSVIPAALAIGYYAALAAISLIPRHIRKPRHSAPQCRFLVLIPAHNEESSIGAAVRSCLGFEYPSDKFDLYVIADNCSDRTAEVALSLGAKCLVRTDAVHKGKGYALAYGFEHFRDACYDAFVILDADCAIDPHALQEFDLHLRKGDQALQTADCVSNADDNPITYALAIGNLIENRLFYVAKSRLHLPVMLRGTGMVLHQDLLKRIPWDAHSIVEDQEYSLKLIRAGIFVRFVDQVEVRSPFPTDKQQLNIQRERWAKGNASFGRSHAFKLLLEGLRKPSFRLFDAGCMLLVLSRPLMLVCLFSSIILCISAREWIHTGMTNLLLQASIVFAGFYALYFGLGVVLLGLTKKRFLLLLRVPLVLVRLIWISLCGLTGTKDLQWTRTPRSR